MRFLDVLFFGSYLNRQWDEAMNGLCGALNDYFDTDGFDKYKRGKQYPDGWKKTKSSIVCKHCKHN